ALNANAHRLNAHTTVTLQQPQPRQLSQIASLNPAPQRSSAPATPASALQQQRPREREHSLGADRKRKLGALAGANLPAQPSNLRQSSLGPGTPKAGTPTATTVSRAGSVPRATTATPYQSAMVAAPKKNTLSKKAMVGNLNKLKNKHTKRVSLDGRKKGQSPSVRSGRGGTVASEGDDSVLSSADASETDASQSRSRGGRKKKVKQEVEIAEDGDHEDEE
ncbi:MAG: Histone acetyltransferase complex subunit, partial [Watsoniomyces obsoletus]